MAFALEFFERRGEPFGVARQERTGGVGQVLALPSYGELNQRADERGEDEQQNTDDGEPTAAASVSADPESREIRQNRECPNEHHHDRHDPDVFVFDV